MAPHEFLNLFTVDSPLGVVLLALMVWNQFQLNQKLAVILLRSDTHEKRLDRIEGQVFKTKE